MFYRFAALVISYSWSILFVGIFLFPVPTEAEDISPLLVSLHKDVLQKNDPGTSNDKEDNDDESLESLLNMPLEQLNKMPVRGNDIEPISTTVSRVEERVSEVPGSVYVYTRETIIKRGYRSLADLLKVVPGFTVFHRDLGYVAGVRGLNANDNEKITLLINGEEVNGVQEPNILNGPINLDNVERVEVVVGPSSFFQRANTLAATINIITLNPNGSELIFAAGNALRYSGTYMTGRRKAPDNYDSFSFTTEEIAGFDAWSEDFLPNLAGRNLTGSLRQPNFFSVLRRQRGEWIFQGTAYRTESPELNIDSGNPTNNGVYMDQLYALYLKNEHPITNSLTRIFTTDAIYKQQSRDNYGGPPVWGTALQVNCSQMAYSAEWGYRYTGIDGHLIQAGVQFEYDQNFNCFYIWEGDKSTLVDGNSQELGIYIDDEIQLTDRLKIIGGVRQDHNTIVPGDKWYTGIRSAIIRRNNDNWTTKVMFNRAVRMPAPWASYLNVAWGNDKPNPPEWAKLAPNARYPEILSTVELQNIFYIDKTRISIDVYHEDLNQFISWYEPHTNIGNFRGTGVELDVRAPVNDRMLLWGNMSYVSSELLPFEAYLPGPGPIEQQHIIVNPDGRIIGSPEWTANLGFERKIGEHLIFSPTVRYFTEQAGFDYTTSQFIYIRNIFYFDATLMWKDFLVKNMDARLSGYNITNNRSAVAGQWVRDTYLPRGSTAVFSLNWRY